MSPDKLRILVVFGTRPEAIKMAPVIRTLQTHTDACIVRTCATAQHREMLDQVLDVFGIVPDIDLNLMRANQSLSGLGARVLSMMDNVIVDERPDWVLVQGDTTTVMMTALAAQHRKVQVGHVEAGLRTYDRRNPFPEEMNRVVTDHISDLCFAPTERARQHLLQEGIDDAKVVVTGNTVIDALLWAATLPAPLETQELLDELGIIEKTTKEGDRETRKRGHMVSVPPSLHLLLVTAHRRENHGQPLINICQALKQITRERGQHIHIIYPVHRNPNVWQPVHTALAGNPNITLLPPLDYRSLIYLMQRSVLILTDSGGIQEEAPSLNKPVLVLRETTERPEAVDAGASLVIGTDPRRIVTETYRLLDDPVAYTHMAAIPNPYGDGHAAERIAKALLQR